MMAHCIDLDEGIPKHVPLPLGAMQRRSLLLVAAIDANITVDYVRNGWGVNWTIHTYFFYVRRR
jgi:hypothetical protein